MKMTKVKCNFCKQLVNEINDHGTCKDCWCSEGELKWKLCKKTKEDMIQNPEDCYC